MFKTDFLAYCCGFVSAAILWLLFSYPLFSPLSREDTAKEVMQTCANTGMYLHKGYAISCRVLVDAPHDAKEVKI